MTGQPGTHCPKLSTHNVCSIQLSLGSAAFYKIITTAKWYYMPGTTAFGLDTFSCWILAVTPTNRYWLHFIEEETGTQGEQLNVFVMDCCIKNYPPTWWLKTTKYIVLLCYVNMYIVNHIAVFKALVHIWFISFKIYIHTDILIFIPLRRKLWFIEHKWLMDLC